MKRKAKEQGPPTIVAYELREEIPAGMTETFLVDRWRAAEGETDALRMAREIRIGWDRTSLADWRKMRNVTVARVMSDGSKGFVDISEVIAMLDAPSGAVPISSLVAPKNEAGKAKGKWRSAKGKTKAADSAPAAAPVSTTDADALPRCQSVFTIGYEGGLTLETLLNLVREYKITRIVDTRQSTRCKNQAFTGTALAKLEEAYVCAPSEREVFAAIERFVTREGRSILLLRKEESPCESPYHLQLAKRVAMTHFFRDEVIDGASLQAALDADERDPSVDHQYECVKEFPDVVETTEVAQAS